MCPFPFPEEAQADTADLERDAEKLELSPPSYFYAQGRAILLASDYFRDERLNGNPGTATKHRDRYRGALFVQLMANFEYLLKTFAGRIIELSDVHDEQVAQAKWIAVEKEAVLAHRDRALSLASLLFHGTQGWHKPEDVNKHYESLFQHGVFSNDDAPTVETLWIVRHSLAHNGGFVGTSDAYRARMPELGGKTIVVSHEYLEATFTFLLEIVKRLTTDVGQPALKRWVKERAKGDWMTDRNRYREIAKTVTLVESRAQSVPDATRASYDALLAAP